MVSKQFQFCILQGRSSQDYKEKEIQQLSAGIMSMETLNTLVNRVNATITRATHAGFTWNAPIF